MLWVVLLWALAGLGVSYWMLYMFRKVEEIVKNEEEGAKTLLPQLTLVYTVLDALPPGSLQIMCIVAWPWLLYQVFISN